MYCRLMHFLIFERKIKKNRFFWHGISKLDISILAQFESEKKMEQEIIHISVNLVTFVILCLFTIGRHIFSLVLLVLFCS
jgi:hypothetical protein